MLLLDDNQYASVLPPACSCPLRKSVSFHKGLKNPGLFTVLLSGDAGSIIHSARTFLFDKR